ncbi:MAG TPA: PAS domain S-box protein [Ktedonobacteraceae bacterium]|jgi:PAS domain S-box-containing protein|nr:PAS domain S-box protein [Ktedonobacteraceae bacterium]
MSRPSRTSVSTAEVQRLKKRRMQAFLARVEFRSLIETVPDALLMVDEQGRIALVNHQAEQLFGYSRQELLGRDLEYLLPERFRALHLQHRYTYLQGPTVRPMGLGLELYGRRKDGSEFPVDISLSPIQTIAGFFIISSIRDTTERGRLEQAAHAHLTLLQAVIDALPSGVFLVQGKEAELVFANRAVAEIWGTTWTPGQSLHDFLQAYHIRVFDSDERELAYDQLATIRAIRTRQPILQYQEVIRHPDGTHLPILFNAVPLRQEYFQHLLATNAETEGVLVIMQDITALKAVEQMKEEFIGLAAHELRTPLAALQGFVDMLVIQTQRGKGPALADWQNEALAEIQLATSRLMEFSEALLDITHIQAGRLILHVRPTDLVDLLQKVVKRVQDSTWQHTLHLRTATGALFVPIDALRIDQVFFNLLSNAVKYSPGGGVIEIDMSLDQQRRQALISIRDQGIGIPAHQQALLFQRFTRADNTQGIIGAGLGLCLCREYVERHGGRIWFESVEHQGSTFFVSLPLLAHTSSP